MYKRKNKTPAQGSLTLAVFQDHLKSLKTNPHMAPSISYVPGLVGPQVLLCVAVWELMAKDMGLKLTCT
jgi:hypothetical protein